MPIDPSIPLQAKGVQLESPTNQLAMYGNVMKIGEMQRGIEEQNMLNEYLKSGADLSTAEGKRGLLNYGQTGFARAKAIGDIDKSRLEEQKLRLEVDSSQRIGAVQKVVSAPDANTAAGIIQSGMADGTVPAAQGNQMLKNLSSMKYPDWQMSIIRSVVDPKTIYTHGTISENTKATLAQSDSHFKQRLAQETATGTLTPQTTDLLAQTYIQTGVLPSMGMGKTATAMRQNVLNRAAEMTMGAQTNPDGTAKPMPTAAEAATTIAENKQNIASQAKAVKDFSTGIQGRQVNSFNTAINHLDTMEGFATALQNGDTKAVNVIANQIAKQTGAPAPTTFDAAKRIVSAEIVKTIVANGGGVKERDEAANDFSAANSPAQLKSVMNSYKELMGGQLKSLNLQYENTTGRKDFDKKLTPAAKKSLSNLRSEGGGSMPSSGAIDMLKQNPALAPEYDAKFGAGAAAKVLGR